MKQLAIAEIENHSPDGKKFSFGVGRGRMQPMHIDEIVRHDEKQLLGPGPGRYEPPKSFGKKGIKRSMGLRISYQDDQLKKQAHVPGPGSYEQPECGVIDEHSLRQI